MKMRIVTGRLMLVAAVALVAGSGVKAQSPQEITIPLSDPSKRGKLKAFLNVGSITVTGTGRKDVLVRYKSGEDSDEINESRKNVNESNKNKNASPNKESDLSRAGLKRIGGGGMNFEITETGNFVKVESKTWNHEIDLEIEIPSGMDVRLHTYNDGDLTITNVQGEISLSNFNGAITALNIAGSAVASTYNGDIKLTFDRVTENTPMSYSTFNGDIDVTFPASLKASLKLKTERGELLTGFDVKMVNSGPVEMKDKQAGVYKVVIDDWKVAEVNGGGAEIVMQTYNGDVIVRKK